MAQGSHLEPMRAQTLEHVSPVTDLEHAASAAREKSTATQRVPAAESVLKDLMSVARQLALSKGLELLTKQLQALFLRQRPGVGHGIQLGLQRRDLGVDGVDSNGNVRDS